MSIEHTSAAPTARTQTGIPEFTFADLHDSAQLARLHERFCQDVQAVDPGLWREWDAYQSAPDAPRSPLVLSDLLIAMACHVSRFVARLFEVGPEVAGLRSSTKSQDDLFRFKVDFVRRRVLPLLKAGAPPVQALPEDDVVVRQLLATLGERGETSSHREELEASIARVGCSLLDREKRDKEDVAAEIEALKRWCAVRMRESAYRSWVVFRFPEQIDYWNLVEVERSDGREAIGAPFGVMLGPARRLRRRDGFELTDPRMRPREVLSEIHYCVLCHERDKDSCSKGLFATTASAPSQASRRVAVNPLGIELGGCPLGEKISEMHTLRKDGDAVGALALVVLDNPMCPGTGHRICNDCMKSCIYQKQEPVNIPQIETGAGIP